MLLVLRLRLSLGDSPSDIDDFEVGMLGRLKRRMFGILSLRKLGSRLGLCRSSRAIGAGDCDLGS